MKLSRRRKRLAALNTGRKRLRANSGRHGALWKGRGPSPSPRGRPASPTSAPSPSSRPPRRSSGRRVFVPLLRLASFSASVLHSVPGPPCPLRWLCRQALSGPVQPRARPRQPGPPTPQTEPASVPTSTRGPDFPSDVIALLLLVPGTRKASLRGVQGARSVPWAWPAPQPSHGPHHLPLDRCRGPVSVCLGRCNQSATNRVTETTHFSPSREPGGPSSSAGRLGPPLTCVCAPLFPTCSLSHGLNCLFKT